MQSEGETDRSQSTLSTLGFEGVIVRSIVSRVAIYTKYTIYTIYTIYIFYFQGYIGNYVP